MWKSATIGSVCSTYSGGTPSTSRSDYYGGDIPWITSADLNQRRIFSVKGRITKLGLDRSSAKMVDANTPLIALYGATAGISAMTHTRGAINQAVLAMVPRNIDAEFLFQWLQANRGQIIDKYTQGGQPNLSGAIVRAIEVPLPENAEQRRIAGALRDADELIATLECIIAKKQAIKQGMMQQLLTGHTRLPGFTGKWRSLRVGEAADVKTGPFGSALHENDYVRTGTPIVTVEHLGEFGLTRQNLPLVSELDRRRLISYSLSPGDIVFSRVGSIDRNSLVRDDEKGWLFSGRLLRVRARRNISVPEFLSFLFHGEPFKRKVREVSVGQTMPSLNTQILRGIEVMLPPLDEQKAIASTLGDMDEHLIHLVQRLNKARAVKGGMMQQLLTGRTRLPAESEA